jgi:uncharacterized membrane protein YbhN (UPF0104 family)
MTDGTGAPTPVEDPAATHHARPLWKQAISIVVTVAVLVLVFGFVIPRFADYRSMLDYVANIPPGWWAVLAVMSVWFLVAYPVVLTTVLRSLKLKEAFVNHMTGTAITNSLPSGGAIALAVNYAMYLSWGFRPEAVSAALLAAGVWDWYARIALPVLAVLGIAVFATALPWMWIVSIGGALWVAFSIWLLATVLRSDRFAHAVARWVAGIVGTIAGWFQREPPNAYASMLQFRDDLRRVLDHHATRLTAATIGNHLAMAGLYTACVYAVGVTPDEVPIPWVVLSFALGRFLVMIPVSPGGLGLVDLGWIGLLNLGWTTTNPGLPVDTALIAAGVLLFRALSLFPPIPIGMATWVFWRFNRSWRRDWRKTPRTET